MLGRALLTMTIVFAVLATSAPLSAQSTSPEASALSLFEDAKNLADAGKYPEACPKFEASYKLVKKLGTLMNLADCYEHVGRTASAWARFTEAASIAEANKQPERMEFARVHAAALVPKLSRLTINVAAPALGLQVTRDGEPVDPAMYGEAVAVDPGTHGIEARAPGKNTWTTKVDVSPNAAKATVDVPALVDAPKPKEPPKTGATTTVVQYVPSNRGSTQRTVGYVVAGAAVPAVVVAVIFGAGSKSAYSDSKPNCINDVCNGAGLGQRQDALRDTKIADWLSVGAGVALAVGIVIVLTAPSGSEPASTPATTSSVRIGPGGVTWTASF